MKLLKGTGTGSSEPEHTVDEALDILMECWLIRESIELLEEQATESLRLHNEKPNLRVVD